MITIMFMTAEEPPKKSIHAKCQRCGFEWDYAGDKTPTSAYDIYISCPTCRAQVKISFEDLKNNG